MYSETAVLYFLSYVLSASLFSGFVFLGFCCCTFSGLPVLVLSSEEDWVFGSDEDEDEEEEDFVEEEEDLVEEEEDEEDDEDDEDEEDDEE